MSKTVYLANPYGFVESTRRIGKFIAEQIEKRCDLEVYEPFRDTPLGKPHEIARANFRAIDDCEIFVAVLVGEPTDVGVAVECGYAMTQNKPVIYLRDDIRRCTDNDSYPVNLMFMGPSATPPLIVNDLAVLLSLLGAIG